MVFIYLLLDSVDSLQDLVMEFLLKPIDQPLLVSDLRRLGYQRKLLTLQLTLSAAQHGANEQKAVVELVEALHRPHHVVLEHAHYLRLALENQCSQLLERVLAL